MADPPPHVMRGWRYSSCSGGIEKNLLLKDDLPLPIPTASQHLVKIIAVALNPVDYKIAEIPYILPLTMSLPATPGTDFIGRIITPAPGSPLPPGQLVYGAAGTNPLAGGALCEYAISHIDSCVAIPADVKNPIDFIGIPLAGLTAFSSLVPYLQPGQSVLINGGSGGCGTFGIQIAKAIGCSHITAICSARNTELCRSLGADEVIDYTSCDIPTTLKASGRVYDLIVDNVGDNPRIYWECGSFTREEAVYVMVGGEVTVRRAWDIMMQMYWPRWLGGGERKIVKAFWPKWKEDEIGRIEEWVRGGKVKTVVDERFGFEDVAKAFGKLKMGRARGKIVVDVVEDEL